MYKVYGLVPTRTLRVLWTLEELGQPYELVQCRPQSDIIRAINPTGKVPALQDGDDIITDSVAIMIHLADKHGQLTYPFGSIERAQMNAMLMLILDEFDAVLCTAARHSFALPKEHRVPEVKESLQWEFARSLSETVMGHEPPETHLLVLGAMTITLLGATIYRMGHTEFPTNQEG